MWSSSATNYRALTAEREAFPAAQPGHEERAHSRLNGGKGCPMAESIAKLCKNGVPPPSHMHERVSQMAHVVEIIAEDGDLAEQMSEMRTWLDSSQVKPTIFRYFQQFEGLRMRVEFPVEGEASAFAKQFKGRLLDQQHSEP
jgi:hypothetical protein